MDDNGHIDPYIINSEQKCDNMGEINRPTILQTAIHTQPIFYFHLPSETRSTSCCGSLSKATNESGVSMKTPRPPRVSRVSLKLGFPAGLCCVAIPAPATMKRNLEGRISKRNTPAVAVITSSIRATLALTLLGDYNIAEFKSCTAISTCRDRYLPVHRLSDPLNDRQPKASALAVS